ncbi:MAG: hypothetical protein FWD19_06165, partial [Defluviitaleaceae bacterium]|nr:hypothetical protein [Defluviitaleaceae bacterium]
MKIHKKFFAFVLIFAMLCAMLPAVSFATSGNAWIGGTFMHEYEFVEWYEHKEQSVAFTVGQPFTAALDMGREKRQHVAADWGYILVVQTDLPEENYDVFINRITVDGRNINYNANNAFAGFEGGVRVALTSFWSDDTVLSSHTDIGTFSRLEVEMAIVSVGTASPFSGETAPQATAAPSPSPTPPPAATSKTGNAWFGGTFMHEYEFVEWVTFEKNSVPFEVGVPFSIEMDFGAEQKQHAEAEWGYTLVVQTDIMEPADKFDAFIHSIAVDGRGVAFNADAVHAAFDAGVRVALTSFWADPKVVESVREIGTFS